MLLFQYSGFLEMKAQELHQDTLHLQTAALCGVASTNFLNLMENFYGIDETPEEQALRDAASFSAFVAAHKKEKEKNEASRSLSKSKSEVETEEADIGEDDGESDKEPRTLKQKKKLLLQLSTPLSAHYLRLTYSFLCQTKLYMKQVWMES